MTFQHGWGTVNFRVLAMDTAMHTQKPYSGGTIELNHIVYNYTYYQSIEHALMASVYLSFLFDKQPEIHCRELGPCCIQL
jgi:hypothetical protein